MNPVIELAGQVLDCFQDKLAMEVSTEILIDPCFEAEVVKVSLNGDVYYVDQKWLEAVSLDSPLFDPTLTRAYSDELKSRFYNPRGRLKKLSEEVTSGVIYEGV